MDNTQNQPAPETLQPRAADGSAPAPTNQPPTIRPRKRSYRPSHKATFISLIVVAVILAVNAGILVFVLKKQAKLSEQTEGQVTINEGALEKLGVNRSSAGASGVELTVNPNATFKGNVTVAGNTNLGGTLKLNSRVSGTDANFTQFQGGRGTFNDLDINGEITGTILNVRNGLNVIGKTQIQGAVNISQLLTVANSLNVSGNVSIGGVLTVNTFSARTLGVGGHLVTSGSTPGISKGSALGSNGTVSISGNDAAGTIAINIGSGGGGGGTLASITFHNAYSNYPKVVFTPVGIGGTFYLYDVDASGFGIAVGSSLPVGSYRINYVVMQ